jgi:hypothetical protein
MEVDAKTCVHHFLHTVLIKFGLILRQRNLSDLLCSLDSLITHNEVCGLWQLSEEISIFIANTVSSVASLWRKAVEF